MTIADRISSRSLFGKALRLPLRLISPSTPRRILTGPARGFLWVPGSGTHGCWLGTYERSTQALFVQHIRSGGVVFDVGANVGFFTLLASRLAGPGGEVVAFEPMARNLHHLRRHIALNSLTSIRVIPAAVSDAPGEGFFCEASSPSMGSLADSGIPVALVSLDDLVSRQEIPAPTLLKIDVEGAEVQVLAGASAMLCANHPTVILSGHGWERHNTCWLMLQQLGYTVRLLRDGASDGNYELVATAP